MLNWGLMGAIYAMFHATHGVADYWLQTDWMAQNKSKNWHALGAHIAVYAGSFIPVVLVLKELTTIEDWKLMALPFVVGLPHAWMDRRAFLKWFCLVTKKWSDYDIPKLTPLQTAVRVHVTIHMDQKFHYACLCLTALWLAWGVK